MLVKYGLRHVFGMQFRYAFFLCGKKEEKRLLADSAFERMITYTTTKSIRSRETKRIEKTETTTTVKKKAILWVKGPYPKKDTIRWKTDDGKSRNNRPSKPVECSQPKFGAAFDPRDFQNK
jgi:hypothetical protein